MNIVKIFVAMALVALIAPLASAFTAADAAGDTQIVSADFTVPTVIQGTEYVGAPSVIDTPSGAVGPWIDRPLILTMNKGTGVPLNGNLWVSSIDVPQNVVAGQTITVSAVVRSSTRPPNVIITGLIHRPHDRLNENVPDIPDWDVPMVIMGPQSFAVSFADSNTSYITNVKFDDMTEVKIPVNMTATFDGIPIGPRDPNDPTIHVPRTLVGSGFLVYYEAVVSFQWTAAAGNQTLTFMADPADAWLETNETDNQMAINLNVGGSGGGGNQTVSVDITSPANGASTTATSVIVRGTYGPAATGVVSMTAGGKAVAGVTYSNGQFSATVPLAMGQNAIIATVTDAAGTAADSITMTRTASGGGGGGGGGGSGGGGYGGGGGGAAFGGGNLYGSGGGGAPVAEAAVSEPAKAEKPALKLEAERQLFGEVLTKNPAEGEPVQVLVKDKAGKPVANASVTLNDKQTAATGADGIATLKAFAGLNTFKLTKKGWAPGEVSITATAKPKPVVELQTEPTPTPAADTGMLGFFVAGAFDERVGLMAGIGALSVALMYAYREKLRAIVRR